MTTPFATSTIDSQMHNNIMAAGLRDRPYTPTTIVVLAVPTTDDSLAVPEHITVETPINMYPENKAHYQSEKETIHLILTVATMQVNVQFLQQLQPEWSRFVTIVKQQHKLDEVSYHKLYDILKQYQKEVNELCAERITRNAIAQPNHDPYYQTPKAHKPYAPTSKALIPTISHATTKNKGKEIVKPITPPSESDSKEDNDLELAQRDKDMQKNLALIAKYFKKIYKPTNNKLRTSSNSRNNKIDNTPRYKNDNQSGQFGSQRTVDVAGARENVGSLGYNVLTARNLVILLRNAENQKGLKTPHMDEEIYEQELEAHYRYMANIQEVPTADSGTDSEPLEQQADWLTDMNEEIDEQELEEHYIYMAKIQEVPTSDSGTDTEPLEQVQYGAKYNVFANERQHSEQPESVSNTFVVEMVDSNVIPNLSDMCDNDIQTDQNVKMSVLRLLI
nr:hypothetical protein [Tanacetum cinerariifolium]